MTTDVSMHNPVELEERAFALFRSNISATKKRKLMFAVYLCVRQFNGANFDQLKVRIKNLNYTNVDLGDAIQALAEKDAIEAITVVRRKQNKTTLKHRNSDTAKVWEEYLRSSFPEVVSL